MMQISKTKRQVSLRIKNSTKPGFLEQPPRFYRCPECGNLMIQEVYKQNMNMQVICCGKSISPLGININESLVLEHQPKMEVVGGFSANAVVVDIGEKMHPMTDDHHIEWVYLYTFQGGQLKFLKPTQAPSVIFALAEEDAYVYCDKLNCEKCKFNCKHGFTVYAYCNMHGLWSLQR